MDNYGSQNQSFNGPQLEPPMTLGEWLITMIVCAIPCVGIVMLFVWGFGSGGNTSRKNYCRAALILAAIGIVLAIIFYSSIFAMFASQFSSYSSY